MKYDVNLELENREESYSFGAVAKQANGSAWLKSGNTVILATVVIDETEIVKDDFLPLTVQYIEKTYAAGKIPGVVHISRDRYSVPQGFETSPVPRHYFIDSKGEILYSSLGHRQQECFESFMDNAQKKTKTSK